MNTPENASYPNAHPELNKFLELADARGLDKVVLVRDSRRKIQSWPDKVNFGREFFKSPQTLQEFGTERGISRERTRQIVTEYVMGLRERGGSNLQEAFPEEKLKGMVKKPQSETSRLRHSQAVGGSLGDFIEAIRAGASFETAKEISGISRNSLSRLHQDQQFWGIEIPEWRTHSEVGALAEGFRQHDDYPYVGMLLDLVNPSSIKGLAHSQLSLVYVSRVVSDAGYYGYRKHVEEFIASLTSATVPVKRVNVGTQTSRGTEYVQTEAVISKLHYDEAIQILLLDITLEKYRVPPLKKVWGPDDAQLPRLYIIANNKGYKGLGVLMKNLGLINSTNSTLKAANHLMEKNCPVPIFTYRGRFYYPSDQAQKLADYLLKRKTLASNPRG